MLFALATAAAPAHADPVAVAKDDKPLPDKRHEWIIVPAAGGNSDIGVQFGVALSVAQFRPGYKPYAWRMDAVADMSIKGSDSGGVRPVQQYHGVRFDIPQFFSKRLRLDTRLNFLRDVDYTWYGIGNHTGVDPRPKIDGEPQPNRYVSENFRLRSLARVKMNDWLDLAFATNLRYELPTVRSRSKLADDVAAGNVIGDKEGFLETIAAGIFIDTRDEEFITHKGVFYQIGIAETVGTQQDIRYGEASFILDHYTSLTKWLIFGSRMIGSIKLGNIPYYELQTGNAFDPLILVGGERGVRGIVSGRYAGNVKLVQNTELRFTGIPRLKVFHWSVLVGIDAFFDAGRVFSQLSYDQGNDGHQLGLKYAAGGGFFFQWDQSNVFRVETAWSPDADRGFPLSFYFANGLLF